MYGHAPSLDLYVYSICQGAAGSIDREVFLSTKAVPKSWQWSWQWATVVGLNINILRPRQMDAISQTTFSSAFSQMKMFEFRLKFHWSLFLRFQLTLLPGGKPLSEPMMVRLPTQKCVSRPQWVNRFCQYRFYFTQEICAVGIYTVI